jgi:hypothetical protein
VRELVFALEFRGKAAAVPGTEGRRQARTMATSQSLSTLLAADGVHGRVDTIGGETAILHARVQRFPDGTFVEEGTIRYGVAGGITFETVGRGWVEAAVEGGTLGGVLWRVTGGEGRFTGARGLITSNFAVSADGDVVDDQFARIHLD